MPTFTAFRIHQQGTRAAAGFEQLTLDELSAGDVVVRVAYSTINYKDALAATGAGRILRKPVLVGGIDFAGVVASSADARFQPGDRVLVTGCGTSETIDGGYSEFARIAGDAVIPLPAGLDEFKAMALGTAGFTAALAIHKMEFNGQRPSAGPVAVTGATGGVGSIAIDMLAGRGYEVTAISAKPDAAQYLHALGAARCLARGDLELGSRPLEAVKFAGAIDNLGGSMLGWLTRSVGYGGNIASVGLAAGPELETTVMPFILRGVNLLGINSTATPRELRLTVWKRIATELLPRHFDRFIARTIEFEELPGAFQAYLDGKVTGRTVVRIGARGDGATGQ